VNYYDFVIEFKTLQFILLAKDESTFDSFISAFAQIPPAQSDQRDLDRINENFPSFQSPTPKHEIQESFIESRLDRYKSENDGLFNHKVDLIES